MCVVVRAKYGDKWNRMPSAQLTVNVRADISKYQGILTSATGADKVYTLYTRLL